jgi:hypothetical protein
MFDLVSAEAVLRVRHDLFRSFREFGQIKNIVPTMPNLPISHHLHEPRHLI